jgi:hypothetical protein
MASTPLQFRVSQRAGDRCEYCLMHQALQGGPFHLEHIIPRAVLATEYHEEPDAGAVASNSCAILILSISSDRDHLDTQLWNGAGFSMDSNFRG